MPFYPISFANRQRKTQILRFCILTSTDEPNHATLPSNPSPSRNDSATNVTSSDIANIVYPVEHPAPHQTAITRWPSVDQQQRHCHIIRRFDGRSAIFAIAPLTIGGCANQSIGRYATGRWVLAVWRPVQASTCSNGAYGRLRCGGQVSVLSDGVASSANAGRARWDASTGLCGLASFPALSVDSEANYKPTQYLVWNTTFFCTFSLYYFLFSVICLHWFNLIIYLFFLLGFEINSFFFANLYATMNRNGILYTLNEGNRQTDFINLGVFKYISKELHPFISRNQDILRTLILLDTPTWSFEPDHVYWLFKNSKLDSSYYAFPSFKM